MIATKGDSWCTQIIVLIDEKTIDIIATKGEEKEKQIVVICIRECGANFITARMEIGVGVRWIDQHQQYLFGLDGRDVAKKIEPC